MEKVKRFGYVDFINQFGRGIAKVHFPGTGKFYKRRFQVSPGEVEEGQTISCYVNKDREVIAWTKEEVE